jgi:L-amino acid N-acyltransferase YncA
MTEVVVRDSSEADMEAVRQIYCHYVVHTLVSMEEEAPSIEELARRRENVLACGLPYLVAEIGNDIVGYSYAVPYRSRSAYRFTIENSVYVKNGLSKRGIGQALLSALIARCQRSGFLRMIAVIAGNDNIASIRLHEKMEFQTRGTLYGVGFKLGQYVDTVMMQRNL